MIIKLKQVPKQKELEVLIQYANMDSRLEGLIRIIKAWDYTLTGSDEGKQYQIPVDDIYYIESVDKKTFLYCKDQVFRSDKKLYQLLEETKEYDFIQISKACILNIHVLDSIQTMFNSRIEATLSNGEKVQVSRKYIPEIKAYFKREERKDDEK